jgi:hypothetical protein
MTVTNATADPPPNVQPPAPPALAIVPPPATAPPATVAPPAPPVVTQQAPAPAPTDPDVDTEDAAAGVAVTGDSMVVPRAAFKKIKADAAARARTKAQVDILAPILAAGFSSVEELVAAAVRGKDSTMTIPGTPTAAPAQAAPAPAPAQPLAAPAPTPAPPPMSPAQERALTPEQRQARREQRERQAADQKRIDDAVAAAAAKEQAAEAKIAQIEARSKVGYKLARRGCEDTEYALTLYDQYVATLDDAGKKAIATDEGFAAWVDKLKASKRYLFEAPPEPAPADPAAIAGAVPGAPPPAPAPVAVPTPVNTGPKTPPPAAPGAGAAAVGAGQRKKFSEMTPAEKAAYRKSAGIQ